MSLFLDSTLKVSLVILAGLAVSRLLHRRSAAVRHWVLAATILCALATPVLEQILPAWGIRADRFASATHDSQTGTPIAATNRAPIELSEAVDAQPPAPPPLVSPAGLLAPAWLLGAAFSLLVLGVGLARLAWLASRADQVSTGPWAAIAQDVAREYELKRPVHLLQSDHPSLLVTWGLMQPRVIIPRAALSWPDDRIRVVLRHELAHIRRGDWLVQLAGEVLRAAYWFNPLLWIACARLREESEQACDDEVLSRVAGADYAAHLLELARALKSESAPHVPAPAVARSSSLERRIRAMLDARLTRTPTTRSVRFLTGAAMFALTVGIAAAQTGPSTLSGSVSDSTGAPIAGATVLLTSTISQAKFEVKTDDGGRFQFVPLPAETYVLEAQLPGFKKLQDRVTLSGKNVRRDLKLALGELQETINLKAGPSTASDNLGNRIRIRDAASGRSAEPDRSAFLRALETCTVSPSGGQIRPPRKIKDVRPIYPASLQDAKVSGKVGLRAVIGTDGLVGDVQVVSSAHPDLDSAAMEAVRQWQFDGTLLNCAPVEVVMNVTINFDAQ
jgi:TonB family protein